MDPVIARKLARTANPYPSVVFLAPEAAAAYAAAGLPRGRTGYFAGRAAPMGAVTAEVVIATFYSFQPEPSSSGAASCRRGGILMTSWRSPAMTRRCSPA